MAGMAGQRADVVNLQEYRRRRAAQPLPLFDVAAEHGGSPRPEPDRRRPARVNWEPTAGQVRHWERMLAFLTCRS